MQNIKTVVYFIALGVASGFALIVYAHGNFATKKSVDVLIQHEKEKDQNQTKRLDRIENKLDRLIELNRR